jgi:hypothetical protein
MWWISWFGFIAAFLSVGFWQFQISWSDGRRLPRFSLVLLCAIPALWIVFYFVEANARDRAVGAKDESVVPELLTMAGTFLVLITLGGIFFFIYSPALAGTSR